MEFLDKIYYGNSVQVWLTSLVIIAAAVIVLRLFERVLLARLERLAKRTQTQWDDVVAHVLAKTSFLVLLAVGAYAGSNVLELTDRVRSIITHVAILALLVQAGLWAGGLIEALLNRFRKRLDDTASLTTMNAVGIMARIAVWVLVGLLALSNLGVNVTGLITGVGIGGIAIALAVQKILGDLFASFTIVLDKPFVLDDMLVVDDLTGRVEHIGLKTTRLRSLSGEQLVISNADLLASRIRNFGRLYERRVVFEIGVTYDTPREKLERIPTIIREAIESMENVRFDRCHLKSFGASSIDFETVFHVTQPSYDTYMDLRQTINLEIHRQFDAEGIEFAFPTQTVHLVQEGTVSEDS